MRINIYEFTFYRAEESNLTINIGQMKTAEQVRNEFEQAGKSMTAWAKEHGYPFYLVQQVMSGRARGVRGKSHEIAVLLELKDGFIPQNDTLKETLP